MFSRGFGIRAVAWLNKRPQVPETGALPTALHLVLMIFMRFSVSGQTCGQTENLRTFKTSGEPKKSVFSRGFSVFQNFRFEIGGLHPKLARYQLRYTSKYLVLKCVQIWGLGVFYPRALSGCPPPSHSRALSPRYARLGSLLALGGFTA